MAGVMSRQNYESFQSDTKPLKVSVCTSANAINVQGFIDQLASKFPDLDLDVQYYELPYNDIDHFEIKGSDVNIMILCHSINNRRFAITDVLDALYDKFLPNSAKILGKARVCVLVHDFPSSKGLDTPDKYRAEMENFESMQGTTFKQSSLVMMCGKLDGPVEMQETNWEDLKKFLVKAAMTPMPSKPCFQPPLDFFRKRWPAIIVVLAIAAVVGGLAVGLGKSSPSATTTPSLPGSTPTTATTPTTISPKETTQPPTTVPTTETDTPPNPTTVPTTETDTPPNPTAANNPSRARG
ncbi:uncharacterized protein LOC100888478 [Strongylocentrotus purpuratus]|uniref:Uncharacterized protein n=1 Tax=Strongylocentrotus purpuratus TaxID=7668 RepID=A0A7M7GLL0_STRPU|nr:uncharacterized protein LOC100888478 [Strongylocentrotus purpuratus]|eukprot:XP_003727663.1 PREDICTED: uncharacterized protein LOC100888478 [Strongylocentrotus purpuratus]